MSSGGRFAFFMTNIGLTVVVVMAASLWSRSRSCRWWRHGCSAANGRVRAPVEPFLGDAYAGTLRFMLRHRLAFAAAVDPGPDRIVAPLSEHRALLFQLVLRAPADDHGGHAQRATRSNRRGSSTTRSTRCSTKTATSSRSPTSPTPSGAAADVRADGRGATDSTSTLVDEETSKLDTGQIRDRIEAAVAEPGPASPLPSRVRSGADTVPARTSRFRFGDSASRSSSSTRNGPSRRCPHCPGFGTPIPRSRAEMRRCWCGLTANESWPRDCRRRRSGKAYLRRCRRARFPTSRSRTASSMSWCSTARQDRQTLDQLKKLPVGFGEREG